MSSAFRGFRPSGAGSQQQGQQAAPTVDVIDWPSLDGLEPPPRRWVVDRLIPCKQVSGIWGVGGVGKSMLAQQLATCAALGRDFLGMGSNGRPVVLVTTEEDEAEAWRRQLAICRAFGTSLNDLDGKLFITARSGLDNALATLDPLDDLPKLTPLMAALEDKTKEVGATTLVLDNLTQVFACEDHKRHVVTNFINQMIGTAARLGEDGAVLLVGHTAKQRGSEFSGSQAWNDDVRARLFMARDEENPDVITLDTAKVNYAGRQVVGLAWRDDVLRPVSTGHMDEDDRIAVAVRAGEVQERFLAALDKLTALGLTVSHNPGKNYAPKVLREFADDVLGDASDGEVKDAMRTLIRDGRVRQGQVGTYSNRNPRYGLVRPPEVDLSGFMNAAAEKAKGGSKPAGNGAGTAR